MIARMRVGLAVLALALAACASPPRGGPGTADPGEGLPHGWRADAATGDFVHERTGYRFAAMRGACRRDWPHNYDADGDNTSVPYLCPESGVWLTLYLYPASYGGVPDPPTHFRGVVGDALSAHAGAKVERAVQGTFPLGPRDVEGFAAFLRWFEPEHEVGSFVVLVPDGDRFVKVRTSVGLGVADEGIDAAWQLTNEVLRGVAKDPGSGSATTTSE
jgi:hypothetical protein